jgi:hypothetical protein
MNKAPGTKLQIHGERGGRDMAPQAWTVHGIGWPVIVRDTDGKLAKVAGDKVYTVNGTRTTTLLDHINITEA